MKTNLRLIPILLATFLLFICFTLISFRKAEIKSPPLNDVSEEQMKQLKSRTVLFVLPVSEYPYLEDYKAMLPTAWSLTPIEVIKFDEMERYENFTDRYAFFIIRGYEITTPTHINTHFYLDLTYDLKDKKHKKVHSGRFCRIELSPEFETVNYNFEKPDIVEQVYERSQFRNFSVPYMMAYLRFVQKNLLNKKNAHVYDEYTDAALRNRLQKDTLYIPENTVYNRNKFTGAESKKDEKFFDSYGGRYKHISDRDLIDLIKNRDNKKPIFIFEYVLSSTEKYVSVLEVNSGTFVYRRITPLTYNLKQKDIERILN